MEERGRALAAYLRRLEEENKTLRGFVADYRRMLLEEIEREERVDLKSILRQVLREVDELLSRGRR